jgi:hypothetical protein
MPALVALISFRLEHHFFMANRANYSGTGTHIPALKTMVKPAVLIDIQEDIPAAAGTTFGFPFGHLLLHFQTRPTYQTNRADNQ